MYLSTFPCLNCFDCGLKDRSNDEDGPESSDHVARLNYRAGLTNMWERPIAIHVGEIHSCSADATSDRVRLTIDSCARSSSRAAPRLQVGSAASNSTWQNAATCAFCPTILMLLCKRVLHGIRDRRLDGILVTVITIYI